ncbi:MAG: ATP synthase F1 subunit delta [Ilumatobacteraceae bacterium]
MSDSRIEGYARGLFEIARAEGTIDEVEDELFRFARSYESSDELRNALSDEQIPAAKRQAIVDKLVARASSAKNLEVAEVRSAIPLTPDQETRLAAALANATGKQVNLKVVVDPSVLGGLVATVGDTVIDGTVRTRIEQLKSRL